jgi:hypothetical protein
MKMLYAIRFSGVILFMLGIVLTVQAQKTTRQTISESKVASITMRITEKEQGADTLFLMSGQNAKYTRVINTIILKHGNPNDINDLLTECLKFLPEAEDTSLEYKGNTLMALGKGRIMLFGSGRDKMGYIVLDKSAIAKLQTDLKGYL